MVSMRKDIQSDHQSRGPYAGKKDETQLDRGAKDSDQYILK